MSSMRIKENSEIFDVLISVRRVTKVVKGGRIFAFSSLILCGDKHGHVGFASADAREVGDAKNKASRLAHRNMVKVPIYQSRTIHHDTYGSYNASKVLIRKARPGTGVIAGGAMRSLLDLAGYSDIVAKSLGSSNPYTVVMATFNALKNLSIPKDVSNRRGKKISEL
jgi:small subunit ribosomal protein S5